MNISLNQNVVDSDPDEVHLHAAAEFTTDEKGIAEKILHILSIYPRLGWSMLQVAIGTAVPPALWKPVAQRMAREGKLRIYQIHVNSPAGRTQGYTVITAAPTPTQESVQDPAIQE